MILVANVIAWMGLYNAIRGGDDLLTFALVAVSWGFAWQAVINIRQR